MGRRGFFLGIGVLLLLLGVAPEATAQPVPEARADTLAPADPPYSPRGAFLRSLALPGWGQAYVGSPGRGSVYFSLAASSAWMTYVSHRQKADAAAQQEALRNAGVLGPLERTDLYDARAQQFEDWTTLSIFLVFFAAADAYVAAYLSDFDDRIGIDAFGDGGFRIRATLPVGSP